MREHLGERSSAGDSVDGHMALWSREPAWMDPVKEAIFARFAILARHAAQARRETLDPDGLRHWRFKVLLMLRRSGPPYAASPSHLADLLGLTRGALSARLAPLEDAGPITRTHEAADRWRSGSPRPDSPRSNSTRCRRKRVRTRCPQC
ncbi:MarR family winged helix-turn-helix transcriptional regulator [Streptomyces fagopyri]|uniref:MarR family winged helix-turn-helix transcriptional regulator n=1 Tax=Streptomyces fagopyri TaxID=2662397 RepID=UPI0033FA99EB